MLYDTHSHVNFAAFKENYKDVIHRTLDAGVWMNNVGTQKNTSTEAARIANEFPEGVYAVVGLHPIHTLKQEVDEEEDHFTTREEIFDYDYYLSLAKDPKVVGIGECGLDYYRIPAGMEIADVRVIQANAFRKQIQLANQTGKTLVIHCRPSQGTADAYEDVLKIIDEEHPQKFEVHSFTGNWQVCGQFLERGGYIGLNGIITFDKTGILREVANNCPLEKIVLETDAPYLAPQPFRGKKNEPMYVEYVARCVADIKRVDYQEVAEATTANARKLFGV